ncbi:hypothetical protein DFH07DRAFT_911447 [Mycena maculata]|uniref:BTB domain-containing protein n=1 Tax=Mycena maculata TaxID=230809 RepID=A0AAD7K3M2_9AGAR|nr:hypothetical protein DFH07DRAFT_911447 [Mycena maculata]
MNPDSDSDGPPTKRQRTEPEPTRSDIWHADGSVVLEADATQFRVHWSVLALHSSLFRDLRDRPQSPDHPRIEGCPVVQLSDTSRDLKHLLDALYDPLLFSGESLPFQLISSVIRMGRKYGFKKLLDAAVGRLAYENPTTLAAHDAMPCPNPSGAYESTRIEHYPGIVFDMITLAQANSLYTILPCAYSRAFQSQELILDGIAYPNGVCITISPLDQKALVLGRKKILQAQWEAPYPWTMLSADAASPACTDNAGCITMRKIILRGALESGTLLVLRRATKPTGFCAACEADYLEAMAQGRRELWERLPTFFGLPPWDELKNDL